MAAETRLAPDPEVVRALAEIDQQGFTIVRDAIEPELVEALAEALLEIEAREGIVPAQNDFEGSKTVRIYNLLARGEIFQKVPVHERVLPIVEGVLDPGCLVSSISSISIGEGETAQLIHSDDQVIGLPRTGTPVVCNSMWALTDFTEANGATRLVPGSHRLPDYPHPSKPAESIAAEMKKGSVLIWHGSLWHGGGANTTPERRVGIAMNYCAGFIRQQENQQLGIPREIAAGFSPRLRALVGYGVYRNLIGHIDKRSPVELLGEDGAMKTIWDV